MENACQCSFKLVADILDKSSRQDEWTAYEWNPRLYLVSFRDLCLLIQFSNFFQRADHKLDYIKCHFVLQRCFRKAYRCQNATPAHLQALTDQLVVQAGEDEVVERCVRILRREANVLFETPVRL